MSFYFGDWDIFESEEAYYQWTERWVAEVARVLKPSGHIVCFFDKWKIGELVNIGKKYGISGRQPLFWIKSNPVPCAWGVNFMSAIEMAYWGTKWDGQCKSKATFNFKLGQHPDYLKCSITPTSRTRKRHPCEKHPAWVEWVMSYLSKEGDVILDCFAGTGVVAEVAKRLRRNYILIEKEKEYFDIIKKRLSQQVLLGAPAPENLERRYAGIIHKAQVEGG